MSYRAEFEENGFIVVESGIPEETLLLARQATGPLQPKEYHWNVAGKRIFEGWKSSDAVRECVWTPKIVDAIKEVCGLTEEPRPFQTINTDRPTLQALHQDGIHFQTEPGPGGIVGVWLALEDVDESNGTLAYVPGSHRMPFMAWQDMGFKKCAVGQQYEQYARYEAQMESIGCMYGGKVPFRAKMGQAFVWGLNMLHGGWKAEDPFRSRYAQVTHYYLPGAGRPYAPMFSDPDAGEFYWKSGKWFDRKGAVHEW